MSEALHIPERAFVIAQRNPATGKVWFTYTTAADASAAGRSVDPQRGEKIGVAALSDQEAFDFEKTGAQPREAMAVALAATR